MRPFLHSYLVNGRTGDPGLSIRFLRSLASMPSPSRPSMRCAPNSMLSVKQIEDIPPHLRMEG